MKYIYIVCFICLSLFFIACDPFVDYYYYVSNRCNENINVEIIDRGNIRSEITIDANTEQLVYHGKTWGNVYVQYFIKTITIQKDTIESNINYTDDNLWVIRESSKLILKCYINITPEDFE
jgi:hypothetical protein